MTVPIHIPRTALLTWCSPESRYAGGAAIRRLLSRLPADRIRWCGFHPIGAAPAEGPAYRAFAPRPIHWRLAGSTLAHLRVDWCEARDLADHMWAWLAPFDPQILWVVPEVSAVAVGLALQQRSGLPLHATVHDAPETAAFGGLPPLYQPFYQRRLSALLRTARSVDAVSQALVDHLRAKHGFPAGADGMVVRPALDANGIPPESAPRASDSGVRRLGMCGSLRQSAGQWRRFLGILGTLPYRVTLVSFTPAGDLPSDRLPSNVTLEPQPYADSERQVMATLAEVDACYLGLWREPARRLFGDTSLSSKLVTYAAVGRPIIVDSRPDTEAWRLVKQYDAGIRVDEDVKTASAALGALFADRARLERLGAGARRLCREEFDLDSNVRRLAQQLARSARR